MLQEFHRPVGAPADEKEIQYISALLQTNRKSLRTNGTIIATDIRRLLTSRHGLRIPLSIIEQYILQELAGTKLVVSSSSLSSNMVPSSSFLTTTTTTTSPFVVPTTNELNNNNNNNPRSSTVKWLDQSEITQSQINPKDDDNNNNNNETSDEIFASAQMFVVEDETTLLSSKIDNENVNNNINNIASIEEDQSYTFETEEVIEINNNINNNESNDRTTIEQGIKLRYSTVTTTIEEQDNEDESNNTDRGGNRTLSTTSSKATAIVMNSLGVSRIHPSAVQVTTSLTKQIQSITPKNIASSSTKLFHHSSDLLSSALSKAAAVKAATSAVPNTIDLVQLTALLFIPELCKMRNDYLLQHPNNDENESSASLPSQAIIDVIFHIICDHSHMDIDRTANNTRTSSPKNNNVDGILLTTERMMDILEAFGEIDARNDPILVQEMINVCKTTTTTNSNKNYTNNNDDEPIYFTSETLLKALTDDIFDIYNVENDELYTTHYEDSFLNNNYNNNTTTAPTPTTTNSTNQLSNETDTGELVVSNSNLTIKKRPQVKKQFMGSMLVLSKLSDFSSSDDDDNEDDKVKKVGGKDGTNDVENPSTTYHEPVKTEVIQEEPSASKKDSNNDVVANEDPWLEPIYTAPTIDNTVDTFKSFWWAIIQWMTMVVTFISYIAHGVGSVNNNNIDSFACESGGMGCQLAHGIVKWLVIFVRVTTLGFIFMFLTGFGNSLANQISVIDSTKQNNQQSSSSVYIAYLKSQWKEILRHLLGIVAVILFSILSFFYRVDLKIISTEIDPKNQQAKLFSWASLLLGFVLLFIQVASLLRLLLPSVRANRFMRLFASGGRKRERQTKMAASYKVNRIIQNALVCHSGIEFTTIQDSTTDLHATELINSSDADNPNTNSKTRSTFSFKSYAESIQTSLISPKNSKDDDFDDNDESSKHLREARMKTSVVAQSFQEQLQDGARASLAQKALVQFDAIGNYMTEPAGGIYWTWKGMVSTDTLFVQEGIWIFPRLMACNVIQLFVTIVFIPALCWGAIKVLPNLIQSWEGQLIPTDTDGKADPQTLRSAQFGVAVGTLVALVVAAWITCSYIPSAVTTVLKFRSGMIGSLKDNDFLVYRYALDTTTMLFGSSLWGIISTSIIMWAITGLIAFFVVWNQLVDIKQYVAAVVIGFIVTLLLKLIVLQCLRKSWYGAFYRRKPAAVNIMNTILECWSLALGTGFVIARVVKLVVVAVMYIGRIDIPFLAPGVGWLFGKIPLDGFPIAFRRDLLIHEAHRHPYIERLALLFMLKLRNPTTFGRRCCAVWRILFVRALMPWMHKYRVIHGNSSPLTPNGTSNRLQSLQTENERLRQENLMLREKIELLLADGSTICHPNELTTT